MTPSRKKTILVADNSPLNRLFLCGMLKDDYIMLEAGDGQEALDMIRLHKNIDLVLLDIMMPRKDGYQFMEEKSADGSMRDIPVIVVTAGNDAATELRALDLGAVDFLSKPIEPMVAKRRIQLALDQRELEELHIANRIYEERQHAFDHDRLTGIYSKAAFCRETQALIDRQPQTDYMIIRCDLEKFKLVNALFGIATGDAVLIACAQSIRDHIGVSGTYGRLDADNFAMCVPTHLVDVEQLIAGIASDLASTMRGFGLTQELIIASGVYYITGHGLPVEEMCDRAAMALKTVKGDYSKHIAYYDDKLRKKLIDEQDILDNMERALADGEFEVYLQPVYDLATELPSSAEALVRWNRPHVGMVSPGTFIPLFERNGFIAKLDFSIWDQVCRLQVERKQRNLPDLPISVNVSRRSLYSPTLYEQIVELTESYGIEPRLFRIEVTESAYMDNAAQLIETVSKLQAHGFPVLMDDFGSGYSSLNTLKEIPVDFLKLDMKFMEGFERGGRVGTIMASILRMAKWLGIPVIAEGVETAVQYEFLRSVGCEYTQGFYFARPMPASDFESYLSDSHERAAAERVPLTQSDIDEMLGAGKLLDRVLDAMFDACAVYEIESGNLEVVRANDGFYRLFGYEAEALDSDPDCERAHLSIEDQRTLVALCEQAARTYTTQRATLGCLSAATSGSSIRATCMCVAQSGVSSSLVIVAFNILKA